MLHAGACARGEGRVDRADHQGERSVADVGSRQAVRTLKGGDPISTSRLVVAGFLLSTGLFTVGICRVGCSRATIGTVRTISNPTWLSGDPRLKTSSAEKQWVFRRRCESSEKWLAPPSEPSDLRRNVQYLVCDYKGFTGNRYRIRIHRKPPSCCESRVKGALWIKLWIVAHICYSGNTEVPTP